MGAGVVLCLNLRAEVWIVCVGVVDGGLNAGRENVRLGIRFRRG